MKRRFRLGPATTLAIAGAIALAYARFPAWQREAAQARDLDAARAQIAAKPREKAPPLRTLDTLWKQRAAHGFSASQLQKLEKLRAEEARQIAPLKRNADLAARQFESWMNAHRNGAALSEIQQQGAIYSAASAPLSRQREQFYNRAMSELKTAPGSE